jgi:hypothetical protein
MLGRILEDRAPIQLKRGMQRPPKRAPKRPTDLLGVIMAAWIKKRSQRINVLDIPTRPLMWEEDTVFTQL